MFKIIRAFFLERMCSFIAILVRLKYCFLKENDKNNLNKKIMILVSKLNNGGAEKVVANLADELNKTYSVILVTLEEKTADDYRCGVERIVLKQRKDGESFYIHRLKQIIQLMNLKKEKKITHTISFCTRANFCNVMSKVNDKTIISIRNYLTKSEKEKKHFYINKKNAKLADKIVVVSKELILDQVENFKAKKEKIFVINNFCDVEKIEEKLLDNTEDIEEYGENLVINVGRLSIQKGQVHLINSFRKVVDKIPNAKLIILGQGELKENLENRIKELNLEKNVFLLGFQNNPYKYMKKSKVFVLSSFYEGMSNVILEAMYCKLPIISTDCKSGTREIVAPDTNFEIQNDKMSKEDYGVLVPVIKNENDENILANAIIEMLNNKFMLERYAAKSKERIKYFSKERMIKMWMKIIEDN